jgi:hypothetical protein
MTPSEKYVEGQWYGWNGGVCPVHPETIVDVVCDDLRCYESVRVCKRERAGDWCWSDKLEFIIAFRVIKHHVEPKVLWVNEYYANVCTVYQTKEDAEKWAEKYATRAAVRYVETPE